MPRIARVNIPENKPVRISLTYIYGIGDTLSMKILKEAGVDPDKKASKLESKEINKIQEIIDNNHSVEGDLRREKMMNIKRLKDINSYRGTRHKKGLPARGQDTKRNARTVRGNTKRTAGSGKK
jgi:small subunit ribosomal protein S13